MARKKITDTPKPEAMEPVALVRLEERTERVPITPEQAQERMHAAAAILVEAQEIDAEIVDLKEQLKEAKGRSAAKHGEADRIVLDARNGMVAQPFPVLVERHPVRPFEMLVWRTPDGVPAADLVELPAEATGEARLAARESQGCTLLEQRAMTTEEIEVAKAEDYARANPPLPFTDEPAPAGEAEATPVAPEATSDVAPAESEDGAAVIDIKEPRRVLCPYIVEQPNLDDPRLDVLCGAEGAPRRKGFCAAHYELTGGKNGNATQLLALSRRTARRQLIEQEVRRQQEDEEDGSEAARDADDAPEGYSPDPEDVDGAATL